MTQPSLIVDKIDLKKGIIGRLTLNQESTLNSLTLEMVDSLQRYLELWRDERRVQVDHSGIHCITATPVAFRIECILCGELNDIRDPRPAGFIFNIILPFGA